MTKEEFKKNWAAGGKIPLEKLDQYGLVAIPCDCDDASCPGWQMVTKYSMRIGEVDEQDR